MIKTCQKCAAAILSNDGACEFCAAVDARVNPTAARVCADCSNLVTTDATCPLCDVPTTPHPEADEAYGYCQGCANGPFDLGSMHLVTWNEDPYVQTEDGDLYYLCEKCRSKQKEEAL